MGSGVLFALDEAMKTLECGFLDVYADCVTCGRCDGETNGRIRDAFAPLEPSTEAETRIKRKIVEKRARDIEREHEITIAIVIALAVLFACVASSALPTIAEIRAMLP